MKKFLLLLLFLIFSVLAVLYFKLFSQQSGYYRMVQASNNSVLTLNNFDLGQIKVIPENIDHIVFELEGDPEALNGIEYENRGLFNHFGLSGDWSKVEGTIKVPVGTLLKVNLSKNSVIKVKDTNGLNTLPNKTSFIIDTGEIESFEMNASGELLVEGENKITVWEEFEKDSYCGIGSQAIRNECCSVKNELTNSPTCNGLGHWIFNNQLRGCDFNCEGNTSNAEENDAENWSCQIGGQSENDLCCAEHYADITEPCLGSWRFQPLTHICHFECDRYDGAFTNQATTEDKPPVTITYEDPVSNECAIAKNQEEKDFCCEEALKNNLSSGPRPGFPDCIGHWGFSEQLGCQFKCAEQAEMIKIINELKQKSENQ